MNVINKIKQWLPYVYVGYKDYKYISREGINLAKISLDIAEKYKVGWDLSRIANRGFAEEIEKLEAELDKYKQPRDSKDRFIKSEHIPDWGDLKNAVKMEGFGR